MGLERDRDTNADKDDNARPKRWAARQERRRGAAEARKEERT